MSVIEEKLTPAQAQARAEMLRHLGQRIGRIPRKLVKGFIHAERQSYPRAMYLTPKTNADPQLPYLLAGHRRTWVSCLRTDKPLQHFSGKGRSL